MSTSQEFRLSDYALQLTPDETKCLDAFIEDEQNLEEFQKGVALSIAQIAENADRSREIISHLYKAWDGLIEIYLLNNCDTYIKWSPELRVPRVLARSFASFENFRKFVGLCLGWSPSFAPPADLDFRGTLRAFLYALFLKEHDSVIFSENIISDNEVVSDFHSMIRLIKPEVEFFGENKNIWVKFNQVNNELIIEAGEQRVNPFRLDIIPEFFNSSLNNIIHSHGGNVIVLRRIGLENIKANNGKNNYEFQYYLSANKFLAYRKDRVWTQLPDIISTFENNWNDDLFRKLHSIDGGNYSTFKGIILSDIISSRLMIDGANISEGEQFEHSRDWTVTRRLQALDEFTRANPGESISDFVRQVFPEIVQLEQAEREPVLPSTAPRLWEDAKIAAKASGERWTKTPPEFIREVYSPWLGKGFTRKLLGQLDPKLYRALYNWLGNPQNELPKDIVLPSVADQNSVLIEQVEESARDTSVHQVLGDFTRREADRIRSAIRRREKE